MGLGQPLCGLLSLLLLPRRIALLAGRRGRCITPACEGSGSNSISLDWVHRPPD